MLESSSQPPWRNLFLKKNAAPLLLVTVAMAGGIVYLQWYRTENPLSSPNPQPVAPQATAPKPVNASAFASPATTGLRAESNSLPALKPYSGKNVHLLYDDALLADESRARLIELIAAASPRESWKFTTRRDLIDLIRETYGITREAAPKSFDVLERLIKEVNPSTQETILVPPIPARGSDEPVEQIRVESKDNQMQLASSLDEIRPGAQLMRVFSPFAGGSIVVKDLADSGELVDQAWQTREAVLPPGVHAFGDGGETRIVLAQASARPCDGMEGWITSSAFFSEMQARIAELRQDGAQLEAVRKRAEATPLVIIDWNFGANNHGSKVVDTAKFVLARFGLPELAVGYVDLNPANTGSDQASLGRIFEDFKDHYYCVRPGIDCKKKAQAALLKESEKWLSSQPDMRADDLRVNQLVLEAVLWRYFNQRSTWVNMSFSIDSRPIEVLQNDYLHASSSFGVAAAGNDRGQPTSSGGVPQKAAAIYANFVNVTFGTRQGELLGSTTNLDAKAPVTILGPGCGYQGTSIKPTESGSSFSSPYVAAVAWLKFLLDETGHDHMRNSLIRASWLPPFRARSLLQIESAGIFDAPRLLAPDRPHVQFKDGTIKTISSGKMTITYRKPSGGSATEDFLPGENTSITAYSSAGRLYAIIRTPRTPPEMVPPFADAKEVEITSLVLHGKTDTGEAIDFTDCLEFMAKVAEVAW